MLGKINMTFSIRVANLRRRIVIVCITWLRTLSLFAIFLAFHGEVRGDNYQKSQNIEQIIRFNSVENILTTAEVEESTSNSPTLHCVSCLTDGRAKNGLLFLNNGKQSRDVEIRFSFSEVGIDKIYIQLETDIVDASYPEKVSIYGGSNERQDLFLLGRYILYKQSGWQRLRFEPQLLSQLSLRIEPGNEKGPIGIGELLLLPAERNALVDSSNYPALEFPVSHPPNPLNVTLKEEITEPKEKVFRTATTRSSEPKSPTGKLSDRLANKGFDSVQVLEISEQHLLVTGITYSDLGISELHQIAEAFDEVETVSIHVVVSETEKVHPSVLRREVQAALVSAAIGGVQVRIRKPGEIILTGKSEDDKQIALALKIAEAQPGISEVVNLIK